MHRLDHLPSGGHQRTSEAIRGHREASEDIRGHQRTSEVIRGHQRSSEVIKGHQRTSEAIRGHQRGPQPHRDQRRASHSHLEQVEQCGIGHRRRRQRAAIVRPASERGAAQHARARDDVPCVLTVIQHEAARAAALVLTEEMRELFGEETLVTVLSTERLATEAVVGVDYAEHLMEDTINGHQ